jgi:hypothetical protein
LRGKMAELERRDVLLIFLDVTAKRLIPLRWGIIQKAQKIGRIYHFDYILGNFVSYKADRDQLLSQISGFNEQFHGFHRNNIPSDTVGLRANVFVSEVGESLQRTSSEDLDSWSNILDEVSQASVFQGVEFLKLIEISAGNEKLSAVGDGYRLKLGKTYRLKVFQIVPNPKEQLQVHDIELNALQGQMQILRRRQTAVGKYDILTYLFRPTRVRRGDKTGLELVPVQDRSGPRSQFQRLYIPIEIARDRTRSIFQVIGITVSLILIFVPLYFGVRDNPLPGYLGLIIFFLALTGADGVREIFEPFRKRVSE